MKLNSLKLGPASGGVTRLIMAFIGRAGSLLGRVGDALYRFLY